MVLEGVGSLRLLFAPSYHKHANLIICGMFDVRLILRTGRLLVVPMLFFLF